MSVFAYDPNAVGVWANGVIECLNGGSDSIVECSKKFKTQLDALVQPNVWTGDAASQNYKNFIETQNALIKFTNEFGQTYRDFVTSVNQNIAELETSNLGSNTNVAGALDGLSYAGLSEEVPETINTGLVRYDYATIISIGNELNSIHSALENVKERLVEKVKQLNNGESIWDGTAAENAKSELLGVINNNFPKIMDALNVCIKNISTAAENAQAMDTAQ